MALAVTSFLPTSGDTTGGNAVVITGTGLTAVTSVMFGDVQAAIDTNAANSATSLTVIAPAIANADAGDVKVTVLDSVTPSEAQSTTSYTYNSVSVPELATSLNGKWKFQVEDSSDTYIDVRGLTNFTPGSDQTTVDDSDYDSVDEDTGLSYGSDVLTQVKYSLAGTVDRKTSSGYTEDPGQKILRLAANAGGAAGIVACRWYDRNGGDEAYTASGIVSWGDKGGAVSDKSSVDFTVKVRGKRTTIANPAS